MESICDLGWSTRTRRGRVKVRFKSAVTCFLRVSSFHAAEWSYVSMESRPNWWVMSRWGFYHHGWEGRIGWYSLIQSILVIGTHDALNSRWNVNNEIKSWLVSKFLDSKITRLTSTNYGESTLVLCFSVDLSLEKTGFCVEFEGAALFFLEDCFFLKSVISLYGRQPAVTDKWKRVEWEIKRGEWNQSGWL